VKNSLLPLLAITGLGVAATGLAGPARADSWEPTPPITQYTGPSSSTEKADVVVNRLQSSNYRVILNKVGAAPLSQCNVTSIGAGAPVTTPVTGGAKSIVQQVLYTTVFVTADCTNLPKSGS
jgi:hypothetical protein